MPVRNLMILLFTVVFSGYCYLKADHNQHASMIADAMQKVRLLYLEEVDQRQLFEDAMSGMVAGLDQYSSYIAPARYRQMEEDLDQEFGGVGIEIEKQDSESPLLVLSPLVDTPAYRAGLQAGDKILAIDGHSTIGMTREETVARMRGKPGTDVRLRVQHQDDEQPLELTITREIIVVQSVLGDVRRADGSWDYHLVDDPRVGYLRITTFGKHTVEELRQVLTASENQDFEALLLDLRGNAGGLLNSAIDTCDLFLGEGRIVTTRGRDGVVRRAFRATPGTLVPRDMPVTVLINQFSASASEIVAACLQDHGRAVIVGQRSWGKGTVQNLFELESGRSALKLTTASYWRPSGRNIHRREEEGEEGAWGVRPDDGFGITLDEDELTKVLVERRRRDLDSSLDVPGLETETSARLGSGETDASEGGAEDPERPRDPQRDAAWEYLKARLDSVAAGQQTARFPAATTPCTFAARSRWQPWC